ncbi:MAG: tRNA (adenosine(37)-N6)-threonylcarbamoyltransferase complex ATPase subunit type 1 TsaE [Pseudobdellovibrionaceae bacterium]|nr:tRNA (adenosine(37)-N6)-threonylcarbamoyltransferase complex ATPase subunit type 1 TsaE [Pseudobdellovibrionaceae bacterium]
MFFSSSEADTIRIARDFAQGLGKRAIVLLEGGLGAGKSVFSRAVIRELAGDEGLDVPSPTFTLVQSYETPDTDVYHFDLYRLEDPEEIFEIGWEDAISSGVVLVEWPERLGGYRPKKAITVTISLQDEVRRVISIERPETSG